MLVAEMGVMGLLDSLKPRPEIQKFPEYINTGIHQIKSNLNNCNLNNCTLFKVIVLRLLSAEIIIL